jgi:hypothetical protein
MSNDRLLDAFGENRATEAVARRWAELGIVLWAPNEGPVTRVYNQDFMGRLRTELSEVTDLLPVFGTYWPRFNEQMRRRTWRTGTGFVGLGPPTMLEGDGVVVFKGSPTPSVVRRSVDKDTW